jgi:hypothetical protein
MADEYVPEYVDKEALADRYCTFYPKFKINIRTCDVHTSFTVVIFIVVIIFVLADYVGH